MSARIEMYATPWCPYCFAARELLRRKGLAYEEMDVSDPTIRQQMIQRAHGRRTVPQIFVGATHVGGYTEMAALDREGRLDPLLAEA